MAITLNVQGIDNMLSQKRKKSIQFKTANQAMMEMNKFVPDSGINKSVKLNSTGYDNGSKPSTSISADGERITYSILYARAQFFGIINGHRIHDYTTPGTSRRWDLRLKGDDQAMKRVADVYSRELTKYGLN